ncbi:fructose-bisphosphatase class III, partial [Staphylococcus saprophyticus]|uniref:fructose-bisphosphatase class III n=1 Tax=Staphylococcus saprophyticus TaxID=29385 RepID=UPI001248D7B8
YPFQNTSFQTINPSPPNEPTHPHSQLIHKLLLSLQQSQKFKRHITFLIQKPTLYLPYNPNLFIHPSIPLHQNAQIQSILINHLKSYPTHLLHHFQHYLTEPFHHKHIQHHLPTHLLSYLSTPKYSSLFPKRPITTFHPYFIKHKTPHKQTKNP